MPPNQINKIFIEDNNKGVFRIVMEDSSKQQWILSEAQSPKGPYMNIIKREEDDDFEPDPPV